MTCERQELTGWHLTVNDGGKVSVSFNTFPNDPRSKADLIKFFYEKFYRQNLVGDWYMVDLCTALRSTDRLENGDLKPNITSACRHQHISHRPHVHISCCGMLFDACYSLKNLQESIKYLLDLGIIVRDDVPELEDAFTQWKNSQST